MTVLILPLNDPRAALDTAGGKGASLARLSAAGLPVPGGFHVTTEAYRRFVAANDLQPRILAAVRAADPAQPATLDAAARAIAEWFAAGDVPAELAAAVATAYADLGDSPAVAVRSSATAEDLPELSFAGQQETFLNVQGVPAVLAAVRHCWASLWTARAIAYRAQHGIDQDAVSLAAVVQSLVDAEAAGVLFTANPVTGRRDEVMISAAWGLGEAVVGGVVTPDTITVEKATGRVRARETADKQVMTVRTAGGTVEGPVPDDLRRAPVLDDAAAAELARYGVQIEELYGAPMDIEWARAGGRFAILQARPITALPAEPAPEPAMDWTLPTPKGKYVRMSITEIMPGPLSPLFETMGMGAIREGVQQLFKDFTGMPRGTYPEDYVTTINGFAYGSANYTARQWLTIAWYVLPRINWMFTKTVPLWQDVMLPRYAETVARWEGRPLEGLAPSELLAGVREILKAFAEHLATLLVATMGAAAGSEGLFTQIYRKWVWRAGDPDAVAFVLGLDSKPIRGEKALFDLAQWCRERPGLAAFMDATEPQSLAAQWEREAAPAGVDAADWQEWQRRFREYLRTYGYAIYDLDFSRPLPADDPAPMLATLKLFMRGEGRNPYERQQTFAARREQGAATVRARFKRGVKRWAFEKSLAWAQKQAPLREDGLAEVGLGYPALRRLLREIGRCLAAAGAISGPEDIFWLEEAEIAQGVAALERGEAPANHMAPVRQRQALWRARARVVPPPKLPAAGPVKLLGLNMEQFIATREQDENGNVLHGVPGSPGRVTAPARVLRGPEDFDRMRPGEVLVASFTTPAWTPLFAMASAVVTDIGGPLSHSSIVAREYAIPAVLGLGSATRRIHNGQPVTVDGTSGTVTLE